MNTSKSADADRIIHNHVWFAAVPGFFPIPIVDIVAIMAVQVDMAKHLCKLFGKEFNEEKGKSLVTALVSTMLGRMPGYSVRSALKSIPIIGWIVGGVSLALFAGASTYATGNVLKEHFEEGGTLNDLNPERFQKFYELQFSRGKEWCQKLLGENSGSES